MIISDAKDGINCNQIRIGITISIGVWVRKQRPNPMSHLPQHLNCYGISLVWISESKLKQFDANNTNK